MPVSPVSPVRIFEKLPGDSLGRSVTYLPSGLLLFATKNQIVEASVTTGKQGRAFTAGKAAVVCFAVAGAARRLAALTDDGTVFLWDTATGKRLHVFKLRDGNADSRAQYDVSISPNGRHLAVCGSGVVRVCDLPSGQIRKAFHFLYAAVFSPDGKTLFLGGARRLQSWDVTTWKPRRLRELGDSLTHPTFTAIDCSPDGRRIAAGIDIYRPDYTFLEVMESGTFKEVWETELGTKEFMGAVSITVYSPSGSRIAVAIGDHVGYPGNSLKLYNAENGKLVEYYEVKVNKPIRSIAFSPDGKYLAAMTDRVTVWPVSA
jgi:WD40 repeat protein